MTPIRGSYHCYYKLGGFMDAVAFHVAEAKDALLFSFMALVYMAVHVGVLKALGRQYRSFLIAGFILAGIELVIAFQHFLKGVYDIPNPLLLMLSFGLVLVGMMIASAFQIFLPIWQKARQEKRASLHVDLEP